MPCFGRLTEGCKSERWPWPTAGGRLGPLSPLCDSWRCRDGQGRGRKRQERAGTGRNRQGQAGNRQERAGKVGVSGCDFSSSNTKPAARCLSGSNTQGLERAAQPRSSDSSTYRYGSRGKIPYLFPRGCEQRVLHHKESHPTVMEVSC